MVGPALERKKSPNEVWAIRNRQVAPIVAEVTAYNVPRIWPKAKPPVMVKMAPVGNENITAVA